MTSNSALTASSLQLPMSSAGDPSRRQRTPRTCWTCSEEDLKWISMSSKYTMMKWFSMSLNTSFIFHHDWKNYGALTKPDSEKGESQELKPEEGGVIGSRCASAYPDCCCPVFGPPCEPLNYHRDLLPWSHLGKTLKYSSQASMKLWHRRASGRRRNGW